SRNLPWYHELGVVNGQRAETCRGAFGVAGEDLPCFPVETQPGDVVMFNQYLYHGVYAGTDARRYIAMKFAQKPRSERHIASLKRHTAFLFQSAPEFPHSDDLRIRTLTENAASLES